MPTSHEEILARFPTANMGALEGKEVTLVQHGPLAWLHERVGFTERQWFWVDRAWVALEGVVAFHRALLDVRPYLNDWQPIVAAWHAITHDAPLLTRDAVGDLADSRFYSFAISLAAIEAWRPPTFDGKALVFDVERFPHRAEMARVRVTVGYTVEVTGLSRDPTTETTR